jgi:hypothetical protein
MTKVQKFLQLMKQIQRLQNMYLVMRSSLIIIIIIIFTYLRAYSTPKCQLQIKNEPKKETKQGNLYHLDNIQI